GGLAAIVSGTSQLAPLPKASKTLRLTVDTAAAAARVVTAIMTSQLEPIAFEIAAGPSSHLLVRFASLPAVVDAQITQAEAALKGWASRLTILTGDDEQHAWGEHADRVWSDADAAVVRASWLPAHIERMLAALDDCAAGANLALVGRATVGAGLIRIAGAHEAQVRTIERLRASHAIGNVVILRGSAALAARVDGCRPHRP